MNDSKIDIQWNQWLAGLIDGDGYLAIQKNNVAVCEITMPLTDEYLLMQIKQKLGGKIYPRSGAKAVRYRLMHKDGIRNLLNRINGFIRNSQRVPQFQTLCAKFEISFIPANPLSLNTGYIAGFFDADGTIYISVNARFCGPYSTQQGTLGKIHRLYYSRGGNQICIAISNKFLSNIQFFQDTLQIGSIRKIEHKKKSWYVWEVKTPEDILAFLDYVQKFPLRSTKKQRFQLIEKYLQLKHMKAHLAPPETQLNKAWFSFCQKWYLG